VILRVKANTGNAQNVLDVIRYASEVDDFEFDEGTSTIEISRTSTTVCSRRSTKPLRLPAKQDADWHGESIGTDSGR
jgi:hypothetical protein